MMMLLVMKGPTVQLFFNAFCLRKGWRCLKLPRAVRRMFLSFCPRCSDTSPVSYIISPICLTDNSWHFVSHEIPIPCKATKINTICPFSATSGILQWFKVLTWIPEFLVLRGEWAAWPFPLLYPFCHLWFKVWNKAKWFLCSLIAGNWEAVTHLP